MSRTLSEILGASEVSLHQAISRLEQASNHGQVDVRLTADIVQRAKSKMQELGLDAQDTTGQELYAALKMRLAADDERLVKALQAASQQDDVVQAVAHALRTVAVPRACFVLKPTAVKRILEKHAPRKAMKALGYRSLDSLLKHEPVAAILTAAGYTESATWHKTYFDQYKRLKTSDFETRDIAIVQPSSARWQKLGQEIVAAKRHTVAGFKELGAVVLLPLPKDYPPASVTMMFVLALRSMNEIRAGSTYLKLYQVKPDFGSIVREVATSEPELSVDILNQPIGWQIIQRYYARFKAAFKSEVFEPHLQPDDISWHSIERILTQVEPGMQFWQDTESLSSLHDHQPVSMNIVDVALAHCNDLPYASRIVHYARVSLWHELLLRYLQHDNIEQTVLSGLQSQLVTEPVPTIT